ncbi:MAG TPA: hypothetical protein VIX86_10525 [Streptosporangiaceae bacterium]
MTAGAGAVPLRIYLEEGKRWVFACALDWTGWCRRGRSAELAMETLAAYAPRYAVAVRRAGLPAGPGAPEEFTVTERLTSRYGADFGAPMEIPASDYAPVDEATAGLMTALVRASWEVFDQVAAGAPEELRKGPRGGGRDRDKMAAHVHGADHAYARKLGVRHRQPAAGDAAAVAALRAGICEVLARPGDGQPQVAGGWPPRYAARRIAWHALDHAWEIEDRSQDLPDPAG